MAMQQPLLPPAGSTVCQPASTTKDQAPDRRLDSRLATAGALWLIDGPSNTIVRCECVDVSSAGMRLRVPLGFGVQRGQHYELCSHRPGQTAAPGFDLNLSRRVTVIRADVRVAGERDFLDVGVRLESPPSRREAEWDDELSRPGRISAFGFPTAGAQARA